jgi:hypothetical protein
LTPSPEREALLNPEDIERDKLITQEISLTYAAPFFTTCLGLLLRFHEKSMQLFESPENSSRIHSSMIKAYVDTLRSNEFRKDVTQSLQKDQDKLKQYVLLQTRDNLVITVCHSVLIRIAINFQEMGYREMQSKLQKQEMTIKQNEKTLIQLQIELKKIRELNNPQVSIILNVNASN